MNDSLQDILFKSDRRYYFLVSFRSVSPVARVWLGSNLHLGDPMHYFPYYSLVLSVTRVGSAQDQYE